LEALKEIKIEFPQTPVLILSMYSEEQYGLRAIKAGAEGYLKKVSAPMELVNAIKKIVGGGKFISPELAEAMAENLKIFHNRKPHEILSDREYEVMRKIAMGKTAEEIADELSISVPTVYSYRNRVMDKMSMNSNVEIARYAEKNGLID
jgi:DNA-binding NarL/FixJ family response regulator